jgi:hypothetical protein
MRIKTFYAISFVGLTMLAAPIFAGPVGVQRTVNAQQQSADIAQLRAEREDLTRQQASKNAKGPLMIRYLDKRAQLDDVINRLRNGQQVAPEEIDQALQPVH